MGEAKRRGFKRLRKSFKPNQIGQAGVEGFIDAYHRAPPEADIEMSLARTAKGKAFAICSVVGVFECAMDARECRILANAAEKALHAFPASFEAKGLPNLILALRAVADRLDLDEA